MTEIDTKNPHGLYHSEEWMTCADRRWAVTRIPIEVEWDGGMTTIVSCAPCNRGMMHRMRRWRIAKQE